MKVFCYALALVLALCIPGISLQAQTWTKKADMPGIGREAGVCFAIGNKIYFGGGRASKDFYEYDPASNKWTKKADLPGVESELDFATGVAVGNKGYVGFGTEGNVLQKGLYEYDPATDKWKQMAEFPGEARDAVFGFAIGNKAYFGCGNAAGVFFNDFYEFDPAANKWTRKADFIEPGIIFSSTFVIDNAGYVATGLLANFQETTGIYKYDPTEDSWALVSNYEGKARSATFAFAVNGKGYFGYGISALTQEWNDLFVFDPANNSCEKAGTYSTPIGRGWASAIALNGKAYVGMGWEILQDKLLNDWYEFTPKVVATTISVLEPVGGQTFHPGDKIAVKFRTQGSVVPQRKVEFSSNGGQQWDSVASATGATPNSDGVVSINWTVPEIYTTNARIRVIDANNIAGQTGNFTIEKKGGALSTITVTGTHGNEIYSGEPITLKWSWDGDPADSLFFEYQTSVKPGQWFPRDTLFKEETQVTTTFKTIVNKISFRLRYKNGSQETQEYKIVEAPAGNAAVRVEGGLPTSYYLYQNYPNPFNPTTSVRYDLPERSEVFITVHSVTGQEVLRTMPEMQSAGSYSQTLDCSKLTSGIYLYKLHAGLHVIEGKMILSK